MDYRNLVARFFFALSVVILHPLIIKIIVDRKVLERMSYECPQMRLSHERGC